jgi:hypothetical protein
MARETNAAMAHLDEAVTAAGGIALRYGGFYGAADDGLVPPVRKRQGSRSSTWTGPSRDPAHPLRRGTPFQ